MRPDESGGFAVDDTVVIESFERRVRAAVVEERTQDARTWVNMGLGALKRSGSTNTRRGLALLRRYANHPLPELRTRAAALLAQAGERGPLEAVVRDLVAQAQVAPSLAIDEVRLIGTADALPILVVGLADEDPVERAAAAGSLMKVKDPQALALAREYADGDPSPLVRQAALASWQALQTTVGEPRIIKLGDAR